FADAAGNLSCVEGWSPGRHNTGPSEMLMSAAVGRCGCAAQDPQVKMRPRLNHCLKWKTEWLGD
ncbi:MAG: hypothetical protein NTZ14_05640, partial [Hyphomicrobiales bacterium]|nr:hypothetical protein [Hyphomicrobiales bacterium]